MSLRNHSMRRVTSVFIPLVIILFGITFLKGQWPPPTEEEPTYTLTPREGSMDIYRADQDSLLGEMQEVETYVPEYHIYRAPFRYENVEVDYWSELNNKGVELLGELGTITIREEKPIVSVTLVGSGCSTNNYNIVEWWGEGENLQNHEGQLIKRQYVDGLMGQHDAKLQKIFARAYPRSYDSLEEANEAMAKLQRRIYAMSSNYYRPGSIMGGLYENTVYFRIGDANMMSYRKTGEESRSIEYVHEPHKIVIRGGGLDYEDPGQAQERYPADYSFRLIEVGVKK